MEAGNITKAAIFKNFVHLSYKNTKLLYFVTVIFSIFMRQTITDYFGRLHKNMNCAFPLKVNIEKFSKLWFSGFKSFFTSSVFEELQLTLQISLNFKNPCCNLKIRGLGGKLCVAFLLF